MTLTSSSMALKCRFVVESQLGSSSLTASSAVRSCTAKQRTKRFLISAAFSLSMGASCEAAGDATGADRTEVEGTAFLREVSGFLNIAASLRFFEVEAGRVGGASIRIVARADRCLAAVRVLSRTLSVTLPSSSRSTMYFPRTSAIRLIGLLRPAWVTRRKI